MVHPWDEPPALHVLCDAMWNGSGVVVKTGELQAWLRQTASHLSARVGASGWRADTILAAIGQATGKAGAVVVQMIGRLPKRQSTNPAGIERRRRPRLPASAMLAIKCGIGAGGLWLAAHVATIVSDLAAAPRPELAVTMPVAEPASGSVRRIETTLWQPITRPAAFLHIASAELDGLAISHEARRNAVGIREDLAGYGSFEGEKPHLQLITRLGAAEDHARSFVIDMVRRAGQLGLSADRVAQPTPLNTKLGPFEAGDVLLSAMGEQRTCVAFRGLGSEMPLGLQGWWCGTPQRPADRQQLACLIDRLMLVQGGEAGELRAHFTAAEMKRDERCNPPRLAQAGRKPSWLDADAAALPLRSAPKPADLTEKPARKKKPQTRG